MRAAGLVVGARRWSCSRAAVAAGHDHRASSTRSPRSTSAARAPCPSFLGYHGVPGHDLHLGQRRDRARHPRRPGPRRGRPRLDRLRRDRRRLARRRRRHRRRWARCARRAARAHAGHARTSHVARARRRAARRPASDIGAAVETVGPRARRLRDRRGVRRPRHRHRDAPGRRTCPTSARPGRGPELVQGLVLAVEPMVNLGSRRTRLDDDWTVVTADGRWSAHFEHTVAAHRRTAPGCSPPSTAARPGWAPPAAR